MNLYIFTPIDSHYKTDFNAEMHKQNVKIIHVFSFYVLLIISFILFTQLFVDYASIIKNHHRYRNATNFFLISSLLVYILLTVIKKITKPEHLGRYNFISLLYSTLFIGGCLWMTFLAQANPKNTLAMMLLGSLLVSTTVVFSFYETLFIVISCFAVFTIGLHHFQTNYEQWLLNYFGLCFIMIGFFFVSRLSYSYHANYFIKVKTIEDKNTEIQLANQAKNEILNIVAHDLRSPFSNIQSLVELILSYELTEEDRTKYFASIKESCNRADAIIADLVDAAKGENVEIIKTAPVIINTFLQTEYNQWKRIINGNKTLSLILPERTVEAHINKEKIQRVLDNLISNAIKFTPEGSGKIYMELHSEADSITISIKDNGIGIPNRQLPYLFDKFTTAGRKGLKNEPSLGLGLSICRQIVEQHKGKIHVESKENEGTTFHVVIPRKGSYK